MLLDCRWCLEELLESLVLFHCKFDATGKGRYLTSWIADSKRQWWLLPWCRA